MIHTRKRGQTWHVDCVYGESRIRGSLGTQDKTVAAKLRNRIEVAMAEGPKSRLWGELHPVLPRETFERFAGYTGVVVANPTWSELVKSYLEHCQRRIQAGRMSAASKDRYERVIRGFEKYLAEAKLTRLDAIDTEVLEDFKSLRRVHILERANSRGATSLELEMAVLHKVFEHGVGLDWIDENPVWVGKAQFDPTRGAQPFTADELGRLAAACETEEERRMFAVFRYTGLRVSDVADLRREEVHFLDREIVRKTIKRGRVVTIPMGEPLESALRDISDYAVTLENKPATPAQLRNRLRLIGERAGVTDPNPHRFRDTFVVDLLLKGAAFHEVAKIVGDNIATLEKHYMTLISPMKDRIRGMLNRM